MSRIISAGTSIGKYEIEQKDAKKFVYQLFSGCQLNINSLINVFDNSFIERRHFSVPMDWFGQTHTFSERNSLFVESAVSMSVEALNDCIGKTGSSFDDIDHIFFISTTGLSTPSIDALLLNKLKFKKHIKRTPVWGLGCAGGAVGLSRAMDYTKAFPAETVLVVAVELCSLTFQKDDLSKSNLVAASLFSDGAASVIISGNESKYCNSGSIELIDSLSTTYDDSLGVMGWEIIDDGFKVIFSKDIPTIVENLVKPNIGEILNKNNLSVSDIKYFLTHPGGFKVISAYEKSLGLQNDKLKISRDVLREHGNMSSPSVLFVLKEFLKARTYTPGELGIISSLGPGFSSELLLFQTS